MGCGTSSVPEDVRGVSLAPSRYESFEDLSSALRDAGLDQVQLTVGIGFTASADSRSLRGIRQPACQARCQQVLSGVGKALEGFLDEQPIHAYGFGDLHTAHHNVFSFHEGGQPCKDLAECSQRYEEISKVVTLGGSVSFAPLIRQAVTHVKSEALHHVLLIITEDPVSMDHMVATKKAITEASKHPLSIVVAHLGSSLESRWSESSIHFLLSMRTLEKGLSGQHFSNLHLVDYDNVMNDCESAPRSSVLGVKVMDGFSKSHLQIQFAAHALKEVPRQHQTAMHLGLCRVGKGVAKQQNSEIPCNPPDRSGPGDPWYGLPSGWDASWDEDLGHHVYVHKATGQATWMPPAPLLLHSLAPQRKAPKLLSQRFTPDMLQLKVESCSLKQVAPTL